VSLLQQVWPASPHATHWPPSHVTPDAVHWSPVQQAWPAPPQPPQLPSAQTPPMFGHVESAGVQTSSTQHAWAPQSLPAQQGSPGPPQLAQIPAPPPPHTCPWPQARPPQQAWPGAPHSWQTPPTQVPPELHEVLQHGEPRPPHLDELEPQPTPASATSRVPATTTRQSINLMLYLLGSRPERSEPRTG
jgi:hypothetical protein